jgi:signal transduction histidine kinase
LRYDRVLSGVRVTLEIRQDVTICGNKLKMQQVLVNLLKNAAEAARSHADGQVTVTLERESNQAVLTIQDNGPGVPPELIDRIWDPFFTTKGAAGTGLGLDISKSIVEVHGGRILCRSLPRQGAAFAVRLPLTADHHDAVAGASAIGAAAIDAEGLAATCAPTCPAVSSAGLP